jgi:hypothetical protein
MTAGGSDPLGQLGDDDRRELLDILYEVTGGGDTDPESARARLLTRLLAGAGSRFDIDFRVPDDDEGEPPIPPGRRPAVPPEWVEGTPGWLALRLLCDMVDADEDILVVSRARRDAAIKGYLDRGVTEAEMERVTGLSRTTVNKIGRGERVTHRGRGRAVRPRRVIVEG